ncbi:MAG TPA: Rid family detoxifying hydrolase [Dokdonella sp.]|uniref:RidA family protein n=1 Tax=Dokdonella sp. TaxID=2291710 RepID=UPI002D80A711|nr:Rid family detoxifying hydrolase [Dokdonella sp.]HET9033716.1 Rid family detoxifying hydrolase [Dokdonella sp.]
MYRLFASALIAALLLVPAFAQAEKPEVEFINSAKAVTAGYPFSQAVRVDHTLYLSGQIGTDSKTGKLVEGGIETESRQAMQNIKDLLGGHGHSMADLVKCTVMLADIKDWPAFNKVYRSFFDGRYPARSAFAGSGLALGARVEVECIAVVD